VPLGLRFLLDTPDIEPGVQAQDFIPVDLNGDGDTDDPFEDTDFDLPFCLLTALELSGLTLEPAFSSGTLAYTASAPRQLASTTVTGTVSNDGDAISITTGSESDALTYASGVSIPLSRGVNEVTIAITPTDATPAALYTVTVTRPGNEPPFFEQGEATTRGVARGAALDTLVGPPITATDSDSGDTLTYSLGGVDMAHFSIDPSSGQLSTRSPLDAEGKSSYSITVSVHDGRNPADRADATLDATIGVTVVVGVQDIQLSGGWQPFEWPGIDGLSIAEALRGYGSSAFEQVVVVYTWNESTGAWHAYFPGRDIPDDFNDITTFNAGGTYWIFAAEPVTWTVLPAND